MGKRSFFPQLAWILILFQSSRDTEITGFPIHFARRGLRERPGSSRNTGLILAIEGLQLYIPSFIISLVTAYCLHNQESLYSNIQTSIFYQTDRHCIVYGYVYEPFICIWVFKMMFDRNISNN